MACSLLGLIVRMAKRFLDSHEWHHRLASGGYVLLKLKSWELPGWIPGAWTMFKDPLGESSAVDQRAASIGAEVGMDRRKEDS